MDNANNLSTPNTANPKNDDQAANNASSSSDVELEIEKLTKQITKLLEKVSKDDPEFKNNSKKLTEIKKYLERKPDSSGKNLMGKLFLRNKKVTVQATDGTYREIEIEATPSEYLADQPVVPQDLVNMNLDDSILYAIDIIIEAFQTVKRVFKK